MFFDNAPITARIDDPVGDNEKRNLVDAMTQERSRGKVRIWGPCDNNIPTTVRVVRLQNAIELQIRGLTRLSSRVNTYESSPATVARAQSATRASGLFTLRAS